jgi:uncharacterized phage-like protein YoqJ
MKIAVIGSRDIIPDTEKIIRDIQKITDEKPTIISGGAKGVDQQAKKVAEQMKWDYVEYRPNYELYNKKSAPIIRNKMIIDEAEYIIAYWNGESKGTAQAIEYAKKKDKKGIVKIPKAK